MGGLSSVDILAAWTVYIRSGERGVFFRELRKRDGSHPSLASSLRIGWRLSMERERRKGPRRGADEALRQAVEAIEALDRLAKGEKVDFGEYYADLVAMRNSLGRRSEDKQLADSLCTTLESLANNIQELLQNGRALRRVRIKKVRGKESVAIGPGTVIEGWEEARPQVGRSYRVFRDDGGVFRSAVVVKVGKGMFETKNSVYAIEVLEERR